MQAQPGRAVDRTADRTDRPRFRQDLFAEAVDDQGTRFIDVMDPDSGSVFRFYEVEYSLACGMDGERDIAGIVKWAQDELGLTPSPQEVRQVIATLGDLGFIDGAEAAAPAPAPDATELPTPELGRSVVVGAPAKAAPAPELELGSAGTTTAPKREPMRPAPALELGAPGAAAAAARRAPEASEDIALGAPGARAAGRTAAPVPAAAAPRSEARNFDEDDDVSLDLSDHIAVRPDDVKEAVRASKVMSVVEPPREFNERTNERPVGKPPVAAARAPEPERPARADLPFARPPAPVEAPPETITAIRPTRPPEPARGMEPRTTRPPVELPRPPVPASPIDPADAEETKHTSALPVVLLIIVVIAAAGFFIWKYVFADQEPAAQLPVPTAPAVAAAAQPAPPPAPAPPPPTTKIELETPQAAEIKTGRAGVIETILGDKSSVKEGDVVVKFVGDKPIEAERGAISRDQKRLQDQIDAATKKLANAQAAGNKSAENAAQTELATKQGQLATKQGVYATKTTDLEKFMIYAPGAGSFAPSVKLGQKITVDTVVGKLQRDSTPVATFKVADAKPFALQSSVEVTVGKDGARINCSVADIQGESVKVACPIDPALTEGADVTLKVPGAGTAATAEPSAAPAPAAGSAPAGDSPGAAAAAPTEAPATNGSSN